MFFAGSRYERCTRILCALLLILLGFAHKPPAAHAQEWHPTQLEAYRLPDGTLPVLCISDESIKAKPHFTHQSNCEACRLSASTVLPERQGDFAAPWALPSDDSPGLLRPEVFYDKLFPPNTAPRAPPQPA